MMQNRTTNLDKSHVFSFERNNIRVSKSYESNQQLLLGIGMPCILRGIICVINQHNMLYTAFALEGMVQREFVRFATIDGVWRLSGIRISTVAKVY